MAPRLTLNIAGPREPVEIDVDPENNVAYVRVRHNKIKGTIEHAPGVLLDVDAEGLLVGIEIALNVVNTGGIADASEKYLKDPASYRPTISLVERMLRAVPA